jgi:predicted DNA-binding transcriptional regulator AlpA
MNQARYLDIHELAEVLDISASSIRRRLKSAPWNVPSPAYLGGGFPLRWRQHEVQAWLSEQSEKKITAG